MSITLIKNECEMKASKFDKFSDSLQCVFSDKGTSESERSCNPDLTT